MTLIDAYTNRGNSVLELSKQNKVILVFLRHFGCNFCRETLHEISKVNLKEYSNQIVLVHQSSKSYAEEILKVYDLQNLEHISDSGNILYNSFGLKRHGLAELLNPAVMLGVIRGIFKGHLPGKPSGDPYQLPGVFVLEDGKLVDSFRYRNIAQMPPFLKLAS